jgi:regulatory protein
MSKISLKSRAIRYLSHREYSVKELTNKLSNYAENTEELEQTIRWLLDNNYLSDSRYIESFISTKSKKYGLLKLKYLLEQKLDNKYLIKDKLNEFDLDEVSTAITLWQKKYGLNIDNQEYRQKAIRWLLNKGFGYDVIQQAIKRIKDIIV